MSKKKEPKIYSNKLEDYTLEDKGSSFWVIDEDNVIVQILPKPLWGRLIFWEKGKEWLKRHLWDRRMKMFGLVA